jgi:hypothetical protein
LHATVKLLSCAPAQVRSDSGSRKPSGHCGGDNQDFRYVERQRRGDFRERALEADRGPSNASGVLTVSNRLPAAKCSGSVG